jgi:predicted HicB family RNase H-like nuclease
MAQHKSAQPVDPRDQGQVALNVRVRPDIRARARREAIELGVSMRDMVEEALEAYLKRRGY